MKNWGYFFTCVVFFSFNVFAQETNEKTIFSSIISMGKVPTQNESSLKFTYLNTKTSFNFNLGSNVSSTSTKIAEYESKTSQGTLSYLYGITDKTHLGLTVVNDFTNSAQFSFTSAAKSSGYTDSIDSRSGFGDPMLMAQTILKEKQDFRLLLQGGFSPKTADRSKTNTVNGGVSGLVQLAAVKYFDPLEFFFSFSYLTYGVRKQAIENGGYAETSGGNILVAKVGLNFLASEDVSLLFQIDRGMIDLATTKYSSGTSADVPAYGANTTTLGLQVALVENFVFNLKYLQLSTDLVKTTSGSTVLSLDQNSFTGYEVGIGYYF